VSAGLARYSGLAIYVQGHLMYVSDEGQGRILELKLNYSDADVNSRIIDSTINSKPRSLTIDTINRYSPVCGLAALAYATATLIYSFYYYYYDHAHTRTHTHTALTFRASESSVFDFIWMKLRAIAD